MTRPVDVVVVLDSSGSVERATEDEGFLIQQVDLTDELDEAHAELREPTLGSGEEHVGRALRETVDGNEDALGLRAPVSRGAGPC